MVIVVELKYTYLVGFIDFGHSEQLNESYYHKSNSIETSANIGENPQTNSKL